MEISKSLSPQKENQQKTTKTTIHAVCYLTFALEPGLHQKPLVEITDPVKKITLKNYFKFD